MSAANQLPAPFEGLVDLASDVTGAFALYATDDYFAEKENLIRPSAPVWIADKYTDKGKWMDGWESARRRTPGHDWCVIRLGMPGRIHGVVADTTHFKGNAPQQVALEILDADPLLPLDAVLNHAGWKVALPRTPVRPDFANVLPFDTPSERATYVKLRIYPDGGVARLRVAGTVVPDPFTFWRSGSIDLVAIENGGREVAVSDQFFGPPSNLTLPGRGVHMGDGWETKRRRTKGSDWCVLQLGRRGVVDRVQLDTHFFKGNAPQAVRILAVDASGKSPQELQDLYQTDDGWVPLVDLQPLVQHRRHELEPVGAQPATHVRVHIYPHGGVNRMRFYGRPSPTEAEAKALAELAATGAFGVLTSVCASQAWAQRLANAGPFGRVDDLLAAAQRVWFDLSEADWVEAFAAHPRLGQTGPAASASAQSAAWSAAEQAGIAAAEAQVLHELAELNDQYFARFGFVFLLCATGKSAAETLQALRDRIGNDRATELTVAAREQWKITRLRLGRWLAECTAGQG
ncbi:MAG: allantoicase [Deltaproteobacteria bacterium]|nr:allantoicase [Deltaproteobacteria bacterium]